MFLIGRRPARPSAGLGFEAPAPAVEVDEGGRDVFAARIGILLGGAIVARLGNGLTSFNGAATKLSSYTDEVRAAGSISVDDMEAFGAIGLARGVLKVKGMGTVGTIRAVPDVVV